MAAELFESICRFRLYQNYPNPFNSVTSVKFDLPFISDVELTVFNVLGQQIIKVKKAQLAAGSHVIRLDMNRRASGLYFYRLKAGRRKAIKKLLLVK